MQQFQVPQYIDIEDKIIGPLTIKQFIFVLGGVGTFVFLWVLGLPAIIFWPVTGLLCSLFAALAFIKVNGQKFEVVLNNAINHVTKPRLYIWKHVPRETKPTVVEGGKQQLIIPKLTESKLKNLSWSLDINERLKR